MKITVEIRKDAYPMYSLNSITGQKERVPDSDLIQTRVLVDGKPDICLARLWSRDEFHSYFDLVWHYMGEQIKQMTIDVEFNNG